MSDSIYCLLLRCILCSIRLLEINISTFITLFFFLMIRRPPRSTQSRSSAASDVYKRQYQRRVRGFSIGLNRIAVWQCGRLGEQMADCATRRALKVFCALTVGLMVWLSAGSAEARYASFVMDADSLDVLYAKNADTRNYPASLTKIMTLYMLFDAMERGKVTLETKMKVSKRAAGQPQTNIGLRYGDRITVKDAILALVTRSANDVATVIGEHLEKSEVNFAVAMTKRARELGMTKTSFRNASGLPNRRQKSTARDMAKLGLRIQRDFPQYYHLSLIHISEPTRPY
eukprot:TRINITY_DN3999_c0_g1_i1.p1 TRINITY_DN3999_c0_g1~~TRINITY_DN3999_c0_g1_i1.p1  ORF type:complete len:287 (-),score=59.40 TRINITY_DN3999_c0_g1_i1:87-947(-)